MVAKVVPWTKRVTDPASTPALGEYLGHAVDHPDVRITWRGEHLGDLEAALAVREHDIGERAADVDPEEPTCAAHADAP